MPAADTGPVTLRVTSPTYPCLDQYVDFASLLVAVAASQWPEEWGTVYVRGAGIRPASVYPVRADDGHTNSTPMAVLTVL